MLKSAVIVLAALLTVILTFILSEYLLATYFEYAGESYRKGAGHLLDENLHLGAAVVCLRWFVIPFVGLFSLFFFVKEDGIVFIKKYVFFPWIVVIFLFSLFLATKIYEILYLEWPGHNRMLEISLKWYSPFMALVINILIWTKLKSTKVNGME